MYSRCIFCSGALGSNETLEQFPVGRSVAFDAWRGRLWAVCGGCGRWNLAPIEERWEAVEAAEKLFRDARVRVQSENIGLMKGADGTRLIRIGEALPGEIAVLRYGSELVRRRRAHYWGIGAAVVAGTATAAAGLPLLAAAGLPATLFSSSAQIVSVVAQRRARRKIVQTLAADESPTRSPLVIRREHLYDATLTRDAAGAELALHLPLAVLARPDAAAGRGVRRDADEPALILTGPAAQRTVARAITDYNTRGATRQDVQLALERLTAVGDAARYVQDVAAAGIALTRAKVGRKGGGYTPRQIVGTFRGEKLPVRKYKSAFHADDGRTRLSTVDALAFEMALHEESERAALEGELAALAAAWREAEEIAAIADSLPHDLSDRIRALRGNVSP